MDGWTIIGFLGQICFFSRFIVQWAASEKAEKSIIPMSFWYLSFIGGIIILIYSIHLKNPVFITAYSLNILIYIRNIMWRINKL